MWKLKTRVSGSTKNDRNCKKVRQNASPNPGQLSGQRHASKVNIIEETLGSIPFSD